MLQTKSKSIQLDVYEILEEAKKLNRNYISIVERIEPIHPIDFYSAFHETFGNRYFWKQADCGIVFVGIGVEKTFETKNAKNRFRHIHSEWESFLKNVHFDSSIPWTGPLLLGGFSFFDEKELNSKWDKFPSGQMVLPKVMLTVHDDQHYLTFNFKINKETSVDDIEERMNEIYHQFSADYKENLEDNELNEINTLEYEEWAHLINEAVQTIKSGKLGKVVLARELEAIFENKITIESVLQHLYDTEQDCYVFIMENDGDLFVGATPERLVRVEGEEILSTCLAGTISRGKDESEDEALATRLLNDKKNREEHQFVVDMVKDAIRPYSNHLSIPDNPTIYRLKHLQHLYTPVTATLKKGISIFDLVQSLHPTPALGGDPTDKALSYIKVKEPFDRGWYAAPVGFVDSQFNGEFAVAIRSALIQGNEATLFAGCGVVLESDPLEEFDETDLKFMPMLKALGGKNE